MTTTNKFRKIKVSNSKLDFWIKNKQNVLLIGKHGVGKTTIVRNAFERYGLELDKSYKIFSGATLDPWTDFVGVPKRVVDENGEEYLDYIKPKHMNSDLRAIFMDEFNRAKPKVRNALMELIQFKSINGKSFPNLEFIWAAANPDDDDSLKYDVEEIDPAQRDRFQIIVEIPYEPDSQYFAKKFGKHYANQAINWWKLQSKEAQDFISPRRLDYALEYHSVKGDILDVLPSISANISQLKTMLNQNPIEAEFDSAFTENNLNKLVEIINSENNWDDINKKLTSDEKYFNLISNHLKEERVSLLLEMNPKFYNWAFDKIETNFRIKSILENIHTSISNNSNSQKFNSEFVTRLNKIFSFKKEKDDKFIVKNSNLDLKKINDIEFFNPKNEEVGLLYKKLNEFLELKQNNDLSRLNNFYTNFYNKLCRHLVPMELISGDSKYILLDIINHLSKNHLNDSRFYTLYPNIIGLYNSIVDSLIKTNEFDKEKYLWTMKDFRYKIQKDGRANECIIIEKNTLTLKDEGI